MTGRPAGPSVFPAPESTRPTLRGTRGLAVTGHPLATHAAVSVLEAGGNAVDATVAAGLVMTVVQADMCSLGGIAPILLRRAGETRVVSIGGVGPWSATASIDAYVSRHGTTMPPGCAPTVVPGAPAAWLAALAEGGTWRFADVARWAVDLADGFVVDAVVAAGLAFFGETFRRWPSSTEVYWPGGAPPAVGSVLRSPRLGDVLRSLVEADRAAGPDRHAGLEAVRRAFYTGAVAEEMVRFVTAGGGFLTTDDLADYRAEVVDAPGRRYRGLTVHANGPWTQGPMVLQALAVLERYDLAALAPGSAGLLHLLTEAVTLAAADREAYYGDPAFVDVPLDRLLSDDHAAALAARIHPARSLPNLAGGLGHGPDAVRSTTHVSVVDAAGNACTSAPSDTLALAPVVPALGFVVSPRGVQSRLDPAHPAALRAGARPRITPAPLLALDAAGDPWALSCPGGDVIGQAQLQVLVHALDHGLTAQQAVEAPRICALTFPNSFHPHGSVAGQLCVEGRIAEDVRAELVARGHAVHDWPDWEFDAGSVALVRRFADGTLDAGADPRRAAYGGGR